MVYEITVNFNISSYPALENCLFGATKLAKNADISKYGYSNYGIGFDMYGFFSHPSEGTHINVIIFAIDMSSSTKIDKLKKQKFLVKVLHKDQNINLVQEKYI